MTIVKLIYYMSTTYNMNTKLLEKIGLTGSEIKVYLALLEIGSSQKGPIVKKSGINPSKVYEVMDKLISKGLVSHVTKNKVKHFKAAPPSRIKDYLEEKKREINLYEKEFKTLLPQLELKQRMAEPETDAEIFRGWKGMETVYQDMINTLKKGQIDYGFGASKGVNPEKSRRFYDKFMEKAHRKGIKIKVILNKDSKEYFESSKAINKHVQAKYLPQTTPAEINVYADKTLIVNLTKEPLVVMIKSKEVARSFKQYFEVMWAAAKP